jgi:hypothetical protein
MRRRRRKTTTRRRCMYLFSAGRGETAMRGPLWIFFFVYKRSNLQLDQQHPYLCVKS